MKFQVQKFNDEGDTTETRTICADNIEDAMRLEGIEGEEIQGNEALGLNTHIREIQD